MDRNASGDHSLKKVPVRAGVLTFYIRWHTEDAVRPRCLWARLGACAVRRHSTDSEVNRMSKELEVDSEKSSEIKKIDQEYISQSEENSRATCDAIASTKG